MFYYIFVLVIWNRMARMKISANEHVNSDILPHLEFHFLPLKSFGSYVSSSIIKFWNLQIPADSFTIVIFTANHVLGVDVLGVTFWAIVRKMSAKFTPRKFSISAFRFG